MGLTAASAGPLGLHDQGADRRGRGDLGVQPSAEPDRASGGAGDRDRLSGDRQAGLGDAAVLPRFRGAGARGRPCPKPGARPSSRRQRAAPSGWRPIRASRSSASSARHASAGRCTASWRPARAVRSSMAVPRPRSSTAVRTSTRSSSRSSRAATTTRVRSASRPSASSSTRTSHDAFVERFAARVASAARWRPALAGDRSRSADPSQGRRIASRPGSTRRTPAARGSWLAAHAFGDHPAARRSCSSPSASAKVSREEVFGPVTCVYRFTDWTRRSTAANQPAGRVPGERLHAGHRLSRCAPPSVSTRRP